MVKHEEGAEKGAESRRESERWRGEWVDSEEWQERPEGDPHQSCLSGASRSGLPGQKQDC